MSVGERAGDTRQESFAGRHLGEVDELVGPVVLLDMAGPAHDRPYELDEVASAELAEQVLRRPFSPPLSPERSGGRYFYLFNIEHIFGVRRLYGGSDKEAIGEIARLLRDGMRPR